MISSYDSSLFPDPPEFPVFKPDLKLGIIVVPSFPILSLASFVDCLRLAGDTADFSRQIFCSWKVLSENLEPIKASCGIEITPQAVFSDSEEFDYIAIIGGLLPGQLALSAANREYIQRKASTPTKLIGLCTGSFLLAELGLLNGKRCAVHSSHHRQLVSLYPEVIPILDQSFVDSGDLLTAQGGTAALDLVTHLIERHCGRARAVKGLSAALQFDPSELKTRFPVRIFGELATCGNFKVEKAFEAMERSFDKPVPISKLANMVGISSHELNRLFQSFSGRSPSEIYRKIRLEHARWLLANSSHSVTFIALDCGFSDSAHLSRWFRRSYGESPANYRRLRLGSK